MRKSVVPSMMRVRSSFDGVLRWVLVALVTGVLCAGCSTSARVDPTAGCSGDVVAMLRAQSNADRVALKMALAARTGRLVTSKGSCSDLLWSALVTKGLLVRDKPWGKYKAARLARFYSVTQKGRDDIPELMRQADGG